MESPSMIRKTMEICVHYPETIPQNAEQIEYEHTRDDEELAIIGARGWAAIHIFAEYLNTLDNNALCKETVKAFSQLPVASWEMSILLEVCERLGLEIGASDEEKV